jgi:PAS domain S-box-containing protein
MSGVDGARARRVHFLEANLSSISDYVYAFDRQGRFVYANPAMLVLFGLSSDEMLGKTFADLAYPADLATVLNSQIDRIFDQGVTVEDEVFFCSPTGHKAYFDYRWGPVRAPDGTIELVVGVSRDTSERHAVEEALRESEARLRAAAELVGLGIYSWNPATDALQWDERMRAMWGLPPDAEIDIGVFEAGIHPDDLARVKSAIAACIDPAGDGTYNIEYRVLGREDGITRHIATAGRTTFARGRATGFIGAATDVTGRRTAEAAIRASEAQFRSFAAHSSNLIWIGDPVAGVILYRSAAYEAIWGAPLGEAAISLAEWMKDVHPDDRRVVERALDSVVAGEVARFEYRIIRPADGAVRRLRETCFPIPDDEAAIKRIGGITEDLTRSDVLQLYIVSTSPTQARKLARLARALGHRVRTFPSASSFLDVAAVLAHGCVLVDLRKARDQGLSVMRELKARSIRLPTLALDAPGADAAAAVAAMKAGAADFLVALDDEALFASLASAIGECHGAMRPPSRDETASAQVARLTTREREVLVGLLEGGTNKIIGQKLGISPRTVELHRAQVMNRLNASSLTELLQIALAAGITPSAPGAGERQKASSRKSAASVC